MPPLWRRPGSVAGFLILVVAAVVAQRSDWFRPFDPAALPVGDDILRYHDRYFRVVHVVDGDTLDVDAPDGQYQKTRIRLWGVDTPETVDNRTGVMHFGPEASEFAKASLLGHEVRLQLIKSSTRDRHGRLLAFVYLEDKGASFNEQLVTQGYGYADWRFAHPLKRRFERVEKDAQKRKTGLWAAVRDDQKPAWRQRMENRRRR
jgi:micrococcal nuclease